MLLSPRMVSDRQRESNCRNASRSTGPRTAAGKLKSARNAFKHGLTARLLTQESNPRHPTAEVEHAMARDYNPRTPEERELISRMAQGHIRAQHCRNHLQEIYFAFKRGQTSFESSQGYCGTTLKRLDAMRLAMRYLTTHERSVERANQLFYAPRLARIDLKNGLTPKKQSLTGFVSRNPRHRRRSRPKTPPKPGLP